MIDANDLFRAVNDIDDELAARSEKKPVRSKRGRWAAWAAVAACLCIAAAAAVYTLLRVPVEPISSMQEPTSQRYENLEQLLEHLGKNEYHADTLGSSGSIASNGGEGISGGAKVVAYGDYAYHVAQENVVISRLDGTQDTAHLSIDTKAQLLFVSENRLVTVGSFVSGGTELDEEQSVRVQIYDLTSPQNPVLVSEYVQRGALAACYMHAGRLYLLTTDGVCACGWSRFESAEDYKPQLSENGRLLEWEEEDISILGQPTAVRYIAATVFDISEAAAWEKQAFYGDIDEVYYGEGWFAAVTAAQTESKVIHPEVYTFDTVQGYAYTGKISLAGILGLPGKANVLLGGRAAGEYPEIVSVTRAGEVYRIIGSVDTIKADSWSSLLLAVAVDMHTGEYSVQQLKVDKCENFTVDDLVWEEDRAVICISTTTISADDIQTKSRFLFTQFDDMEIALYQNSLVTQRATGVDMLYSYSSPYGEIKSLIPFGNGIYLHYNSLPDGLDVYDFSSSENPLRLHTSSGEIDSGCRFEFIWQVYSPNVFGVMKITPDAQGEYRSATYSWCIYSFNAEENKPFELLREYQLGTTDGWAGGSFGLACLEHEGKQYITTKYMDSIQPIEW